MPLIKGFIVKGFNAITLKKLYDSVQFYVAKRTVCFGRTPTGNINQNKNDA